MRIPAPSWVWRRKPARRRSAPLTCARSRNTHPDRAPAEFEQVRDAYDALRDPRRRTERLLFGGDPLSPLDHLLDGRRAARRFTGPKLWLAALKEK